MLEIVLGEKNGLLLLKPPNIIFPDKSVSIDVYLTDCELPFNPTGNFVEVHYSYDFYTNSIEMRKHLMSTLTNDLS